MIEVRTARPDERGVVGDVLATAFANDPVVRWLMPSPDRDARMFRALASYVHSAPGCSDVATEDGEIVGAALWDPPGRQAGLRQLAIGLPSLLLAMRRGIRRGARLENACGRARPPGAFWYLAQLGAATQGRGVGSALLEHRLSTVEGPAYLESTNVANLPLYQRFGFEILEEIALPEDGPSFWTMRRP